MEDPGKTIAWPGKAMGAQMDSCPKGAIEEKRRK
jgi:hypothetical protein